jgi:hypothetical protein
MQAMAEASLERNIFRRKSPLDQAIGAAFVLF